MTLINAKSLQPGMVVKRIFWNVYRTVESIDKNHGVVKFTDGHLASWHGDFCIEEQPKVAKVGDIVSDGHNNYSVYEVGPTGQKVRLQNVNTTLKLTSWFFLPAETHWSINGVPCLEFFGNAAQKQPSVPPVDVPKRKKRIYNA